MTEAEAIAQIISIEGRINRQLPVDQIAALVGSQHVDAVLEERKKSNTKQGQTK